MEVLSVQGPTGIQTVVKLMIKNCDMGGGGGGGGGGASTIAQYCSYENGPYQLSILHGIERGERAGWEEIDSQ